MARNRATSYKLAACGEVKDFETSFSPYSHPTGDLVIISKTDSIVSSIEQGVVEKIIMFTDKTLSVLIKKDSIFLNYNNLRTVYIKEGQFIKINQCLGIAKFDIREHGYYVGFGIWIGGKRMKLNHDFICNPPPLIPPPNAASLLRRK